MHGHYRFPYGIQNPVIVWRDGRDVMVSLYHHSYFEFTNDSRNHLHVSLYKRYRPFADYYDVERNLPEFIERQFSDPLTPRFTWSEFVDTWVRVPERIEVYYENYRRDAETALTDTLVALGENREQVDSEKISLLVARRDFDKVRDSLKGAEHSFVRRGVGGWRDDFSEHAKEVFNYYGGNQLRALGYEVD